MAQMSFQPFPQPHGMSNNYPPQTFLPAPQRRAPAQSGPFVYRDVPHNQRRMDYAGGHPSFFADEIYHHLLEEPGLYDSYNSQVVEQQAGDPQEFCPLLPDGPHRPVENLPPAASAIKAEGSQPLPMPGILPGHVDRSQYSPFPEEDWSRASIDYDADADASSPGSDDASPLTPVTDTSSAFGSFTEQYLNSQQAANPVAAAFAAKQSGFNPFMPQVSPAAMAACSSWPPSIQHHQSHLYGAPTTDIAHPTFMPPAATHAYGPAMPQTVPMRDINRPPTPPFRSAMAADYDMTEIDQASGEDSYGSESDEAVSAKLVQSAAEARATKEREEDELLLELWRQGVPYKEIKKRGGFKVAESTLRGRVRTLTKDKSERVRKPEWTEHDEDLLRQAVAHYSRHSSFKGRVARKMPWLQVAEWIKDNGGSYKFASAACSKKWYEMDK